MMQIVIPTRGRIDKQTTLSFLPRELRERTTLVCPEEEALPLTVAGMALIVVLSQLPR
jgi:hypothetical protein